MELKLYRTKIMVNLKFSRFKLINNLWLVNKILMVNSLDKASLKIIESLSLAIKMKLIKSLLKPLHQIMKHSLSSNNN